MLRNLSLWNFRCHHDIQFDFTSQMSLFYGNNGVGKTSILEAISMLSSGYGLRKAKFADIARNNCEMWKLKCVFDEEQYIISYYQNKREILQNQQRITWSYLSKELAVQWLTPQIITGFWKDIQIRRNVIDRCVMEFCHNHAALFTEYERVRRKRAELLNSNYQIFVIDMLNDILVKTGMQIMQNRMWFIKKMANHAIKIEMTGEIENIMYEKQVCDTQTIDQEIASNTFMHKKNNTNDNASKWKKYLQCNLNIIGVHKTNFVIYEKNLNGMHASTGEQVRIILNFILKVFSLNQKSKKILLLDDVLCSLDEIQVNLLLQKLSKMNGQIIISNIFDIKSDFDLQRIKI